MHELSLAVEMVRRLEEILRREGAERATRVALALGELSGVDREALQFAFPFATEGTRLEGAHLTIRPVPVSVICSACGQTTEPGTPWLSCQRCEGTAVEVVGGRDLLIESMEVV